MKPTPKDWPRFATAIFYDDPRVAIDWLCRAFGFTVRIKVEGEDGSIHHSELELGEGLVMVGSRRAWMRAARALSERAGGPAMGEVPRSSLSLRHARRRGARTATPLVARYGQGVFLG